MHSNCIKNLLNLKEVIVKSIDIPIFEQLCPCCGSSTSKIYDHYTQPIKDIPIQFKPTTIFLRKTRYECKNCGKTFYPNNDFVAKYKRKSKRLVYYIVDQLRKKIFLLLLLLKVLTLMQVLFLK